MTFSAQAATATRTTFYDYTTDGLLNREIIEPGNSSVRLKTNYTYDSYGNKIAKMISATDIVTRAQTTTYDTKGQFVVGNANALNQSESWQYDARFGLPTSHTGPNGLTTTWSYDTFGRKVLEVRPDGTRTSWIYVYCNGINGGTTACPANGAYLVQARPLASDGTTQNGPVTKTYYDKLARSLGSDTQGYNGGIVIRQEIQYDALGRAQKASRPYFLSTGTPHWTVNAYDALGRVTATTNPDNSQSTFAFHGLTTSSTNALGQTTTTTLNAQGKPISVQDGGGYTTSYTYDPFGNLKTVTDAAGNITTYSYDIRGNKISVQDPDMGTWTYTYNTLGKILTTTDAKNQTTTYAYDKLDRPIQASEPDATTTWTYDTQNNGIGSLASVSVASSGVTTYSRVPSYDCLGRLSSTAVTIGGVSYVSSATYDANGRLNTVTYPSGLVLAYGYTGLGYLKTVSNNSGSQTYWTANARDPEMHLTQQTLGNGVVINQTYDANTGRVSAIRAGNANAVANFGYVFDAVGNLTSRTDTNNSLTETFTYDSLNRLTQSAIAGGATKTVAYNAIGNITNKSDVGAYTYPAAGSSRPHAVQGIVGALNTSFTYDDNGNMLTGSGRTHTYTGANRQKTIVSGTTTISYTYDDMHQRVTQAAPEGTTVYINESAFGMRLEKFTGSSGADQWNEYLFAGDQAIGVRFNKTSGVQTRYYTGDHLGSISVITDETRAVAERLSYDPWGKRRYVTGADDPTNSISSQTTRGFADHEHISNVGLINMNARTYDPVIGRFLTPDSLIEDMFKGQILNRYSYVGNNPLSFTDPTGQCFLGCFWKNSVFRVIAIVAAVISFNEWALGPLTGVSLSTATAGQLVAIGAVEGAASGGVLSGNLSGSLRGAITGAIFAGVGNIAQAQGWDKVGASSLEKAENVAMHGVAGGVTSVIQGGKFQSGLLSAGFTSFAGPTIRELDLGKIGAGMANTAAGGLASVAGGGKFQNGAVTAAFQYLYNYLQHGRDLTVAEGEKIVDAAEKWDGTPYAPRGTMYAGANAEINKGADCSGSVHAIYETTGYDYVYQSSGSILEYANTEGTPIRALSAIETAQAGDIVLYKGHVSTYAGDGGVWSARRQGKDFSKMNVTDFGKPVGYLRYQTSLENR